MLLIWPALISSLEFLWSANLNYIHVNNRTNWYNANDMCHNLFETTLATIHNALDDADAGNIGPSVNLGYIGLHDQNTEGLYEWVDGSPVVYTNWGELSNTLHQPEGEDCIVMELLKWSDRPCHHPVYKYQFLCNAPDINNEPLHIWSEDYNYIWVSKVMPWLEMDTYCLNTFGTSSASIHNDQQNNEIKQLCLKYSYSDCFIGLNDIQTEGNLTWNDQSPYDYALDFYPGNQAWDRCHGISRVHNGSIVDYRCNTTSDTVICNAPKSCETSGDIKHINWDILMSNNNSEQIPYYNLSTIFEEGNELMIDINVDLEYLGYSYAENIYGFGTTYFISFNSFSFTNLDIFSDSGLSACDNRQATSFDGTSFADKWEYSEWPYFKDQIGTGSYLAYPPTGTIK